MVGFKWDNNITTTVCFAAKLVDDPRLNRPDPSAGNGRANSFGRTGQFLLAEHSHDGRNGHSGKNRKNSQYQKNLQQREPAPGATSVRPHSPVLLLYSHEMRKHWRIEESASGTQFRSFPFQNHIIPEIIYLIINWYGMTVRNFSRASTSYTSRFFN